MPIAVAALDPVSGRRGRTPPGEAAVTGDRVEIVIDAGGSTPTYDTAATRAGRRVEVTHGRGLIEVTETTRGGTAVRTARFMAGRVLALVERPAPRPAGDGEPAVTSLRRSD
jgi:hypothetical protein